VRDQHHRALFVPKRFDACAGLGAKAFVADRERLVDQQDVGVNGGRNRKSQPRRHPRGQRAHRQALVVGQLGETQDLADA